MAPLLCSSRPIAPRQLPPAERQFVYIPREQRVRHPDDTWGDHRLSSLSLDLNPPRETAWSRSSWSSELPRTFHVGAFGRRGGCPVFSLHRNHKSYLFIPTHSSEGLSQQNGSDTGEDFHGGVKSSGCEELAGVHGAAAGVAGGVPVQALRGDKVREYHPWVRPMVSMSGLAPCLLAWALGRGITL